MPPAKVWNEADIESFAIWVGINAVASSLKGLSTIPGILGLKSSLLSTLKMTLSFSVPLESRDASLKCSCNQSWFFVREMGSQLKLSSVRNYSGSLSLFRVSSPSSMSTFSVLLFTVFSIIPSSDPRIAVENCREICPIELILLQ